MELSGENIFPKKLYLDDGSYEALLVGNKTEVNLKTEVTRKQRTYVCVLGSKKCSFFGKFSLPCFLVTSILRFALLPYYRRIALFEQTLLAMHVVKQNLLNVSNENKIHSSYGYRLL